MSSSLLYTLLNIHKKKILNLSIEMELSSANYGALTFSENRIFISVIFIYYSFIYLITMNSVSGREHQIRGSVVQF